MASEHPVRLRAPGNPIALFKSKDFDRSVALDARWPRREDHSRRGELLTIDPHSNKIRFWRFTFFELRAPFCSAGKNAAFRHLGRICPSPGNADGCSQPEDH
jgi:hypothetical protein